MLFTDQFRTLQRAKSCADDALEQLEDGWDDPTILEFALDPDEAREILEAFRFLWNVAESRGVFRNVRPRP